jgi:hypothetical protein
MIVAKKTTTSKKKYFYISMKSLYIFMASHIPFPEIKMIKLRDSKLRYQFQVVVVLRIEYYYLIEIENQLEYQLDNFSSSYLELVNEVDRNDDDVVDEQVRHKQVEEKLNLWKH